MLVGDHFHIQSYQKQVKIHLCYPLFYDIIFKAEPIHLILQVNFLDLFLIARLLYSRGVHLNQDNQNLSII